MVNMENEEAQRQTEKVLSGLPKREEQKKMPLDTGKQKNSASGGNAQQFKGSRAKYEQKKTKKTKERAVRECLNKSVILRGHTTDPENREGNRRACTVDVKRRGKIASPCLY